MTSTAHTQTAHQPHSQARRTRKASEQKAARTTQGSFARLSSLASAWLGSKWAFSAAILIVLLWALTGPIFHYSDTWQLVINTGTTIVTFLMVFLIQNTQNRDAHAINLKLDELIHATGAASNQMMDIENLSDEELDLIQSRYEKIRAECLKRSGKRRKS